jgi:hypothetical protein
MIVVVVLVVIVVVLNIKLIMLRKICFLFLS